MVCIIIKKKAWRINEMDDSTKKNEMDDTIQFRFHFLMILSNLNFNR